MIIRFMWVDDCDSLAVVCWDNFPPLPCRTATGHTCSHKSIHKNDSQNQNPCTVQLNSSLIISITFNVYVMMCCIAQSLILNIHYLQLQLLYSKSISISLSDEFSLPSNMRIFPKEQSMILQVKGLKCFIRIQHNRQNCVRFEGDHVASNAKIVGWSHMGHKN